MMIYCLFVPAGVLHMQTLDHPTPLEQLNTPKKQTRPLALRLYSRKSLLQLFLVCAFPLHLWTLLMAFRDFGWVALRTDVWDAVGLVSYALIIALVESLLVFIFTALLGLLPPWNWPVDKRTALIGALFLILSAWSILSKTFALYGNPIPSSVLDFIQAAGHPLRLVWGFVFILVLLSVSLPALWIARSPRAQAAMIGFFERLMILSSFYLLLDMAGIVMIVLRNIPPRHGA